VGSSGLRMSCIFFSNLQKSQCIEGVNGLSQTLHVSLLDMTSDEPMTSISVVPSE